MAASDSDPRVDSPIPEPKEPRFSAKAALFLGVLLRVAIAAWNAFGVGLGAGGDAEDFHWNAVAIATSGQFESFAIGTAPYENVLGLLYLWTSQSFFLGSLLSCFTWFLSAIVLIGSQRALSSDRGSQARTMLIYALLPSSIVLTSMPLREAFQLLFANLAIYAVLRIYLDGLSRHWFTLVVALLGAGSLHAALFASGIILFAGALVLVLKRGKPGISGATLSAFGIAAIILWFGLLLFSDLSYSLDEGLASAIAAHQLAGVNIEGRADYKPEEPISGFGEMLLQVPAGLLQFFFEPFPWHVSAAGDVVVLLENLLRAWLLWRAWKVCRASQTPLRGALLFAVFVYVVMESIWSLGTGNWGTAVRHHLPAFGLLLLVAFAPNRYCGCHATGISDPVTTPKPTAH